jgi:hypothetical protein
MIGRMIRACGADDVVPLGSLFRKLRFQMIADKLGPANRPGSGNLGE